MSDYMTPEEVAKVFGICRMTVYRKLKRGELRGYKISDSKHSEWRIPRTEVHNVLVSVNSPHLQK